MKKLLLLLTYLLLLFSFNQSKASRIVGSETAWKCLGNDSFELMVSVYTSCTQGGGAFSPVPPLIISDSSLANDTVYTGLYYGWTKEDVTPICPTADRICKASGGTGTPTVPEGMEKHSYKYKIYLGGNLANSCWYRIHLEYCCRGSNITTGYSSSNYINDAWLNRCIAPCNSSPQFNNPPLLILCAGQDVCYDPAPVENDGDSLSYKLATPSGGAYTSPYSAFYPLTSLGGNNPNPLANPPTGFNLDSHTGMICFRPMQVQITVLKTEVFEWRKINGIYKLIGKTARDMEFIVVQNCNNKAPTLTGPFSYEICPGQQLCFTVKTGDQDLSDNTRIYWNKGIPAGSWLDNNDSVQHAEGKFCWTPTDNDVKDGPYYIRIIAKDDHCPIAGYSEKAYAISVLPPAKPVIIQYKGILFSAHASSYQWYLNNSIINGATDSFYNPTTTGSYKLKISGASGCSVFSDPFSFTVGINFNSINANIKISPNPFRNQVSIEIKDFEKPVLISLYDMVGKLILQQTINSKGIAVLNTITLSNGFYILEASDGLNKMTYKIEKQ